MSDKKHVGVFLLLVSCLACSFSTRTNCPRSCGNITLDYPFGTSLSCAHDEKFIIRCSEKEKKAFLANNLQVINLSLDGELEVLMPLTRHCYNLRERSTRDASYTTDFSFSPKNEITIVGCHVYTFVEYGGREYGCGTTCNSSPTTIHQPCSHRNGCCQIHLCSGTNKFDLFTEKASNERELNSCTYVFVVKTGYFNFSAQEDLKNLRKVTSFPVIIDWSIGKQTCQQVEDACGQNSNCITSTTASGGYTCKCQNGFEGNPYLPNGCKDIDECKMSNHSCAMHETCKNTVGSFRCEKRKEWKIILLGSIIGFLILLLLVCGLRQKLKNRKQAKLRENQFEENGGTMLAQRLLESGAKSSIKIFSEKDIKLATNNFDETRILGEGGQGIVYLGILQDKTEVAIKKARLVNRDQVGQFVNELVLLSQIIHPHVVNLVGCCLETQVPLLVYEYVSGGTLYDNLLGSSLTWDDRLRIAVEIAETLAYLHSTTIVHRDVKPANILLDEKLAAKVSDFGASRLVPADKEELKTFVQGTLGYLDPEYLHTSTLSEKSDVYSFGVLLMELVSGEKALCFNRPQPHKHLVAYLESALKEDRLYDILDMRVLNQDNREQIYEAAILAFRCTIVKGGERPDMGQVAAELQLLRDSGQHGSGRSVSGFEIQAST